MSASRGLRALFAIPMACLAMAWPAQAQEASQAGSGSDLLELPGRGFGMATDNSPLVGTPPLALRPLDLSGPIPLQWGTATPTPLPQDDNAFCCDRTHFWPTMGEVGILLVVPWFFNRHVSDDSTALVTFDSWKRNVVQGMEWDRDAFKTNMWAHPYHGAMYFNSARGNGYDFWQSSAFSWGGSFLWEMFGEANRPAINDWMATALGGVALGETLHRFSAMIWDNSATGASRTLRELGGFLVNPMGGFNRLVRGEWTKVGENPDDRFPTTSAGLLRGGYRWVGEGGQAEASSGTFFAFDYRYGDAFKDFGKPFDAFEFTAQLYGDNEVQRMGLAHLTASLYGKELKQAEKSEHVFHFAQHFDYVNLQNLETGGSSLSATFLSRWNLSERWNLVTRVEPSALLIWGVDSEYSDFTLRDYDFGSGAGLRAQVHGYDRGGAQIGLRYLLLWQHTLNGAVGDHILQLGGIEGFVPVYKKFGIGATYFLTVRDSYYRDYPDVYRRNPEFRAYAAWSFE